jgi:hypothetical protein
MKKFILLTTLFFISPIFSQNTIESILLDKYPNRGEITVNISKKNRQNYFIGVSQFKKIKKNKIVDLYKNKSAIAEYCLMPLYSVNEFNVYIVLSNSIIKERVKPLKNENIIIDIPNAFGFYLVYDNVNNYFMYLDSPIAGLISISDCKSITVNFGFSDLNSKVIKLNNNFMPVSSFSTYTNTVSNKTFFKVSNYYLSNDNYRIKTKEIDANQYQSIFKVPLIELQSYLNTKLTDFDYDKLACDKYNCDVDITKWLRYSQ